MSLSLHIETNKIEYDIMLERKYTVLQGNSGTGKTLLTFFVDIFNSGNTAVKVNCELPVDAGLRAFRDIEMLEQFLKACHGVVILDENDLTGCNVTNRELASILKGYDVYYILISREAQLFNQVPVSVKDMEYIQCSGKYHTFRRVYESDVCNSEIFVDCIITEDEKSGADFMKCYFSDIDIVPARGKDKIAKTIYENHNRRLFVFYDALSSGFLESEIQRMARACKVRATLYHPLCFEKYLLDSPFLRDIRYDDSGPIEELESFYETVLSLELPHGYAKGKLPVCLTQDCSTLMKSGFKYCNECSMKCVNKSKKELVIYDVLTKLRRV